MLIWIYAEMEVSEYQDIKVTVRLTTGTAADLILLSKDEHEVSFKVGGPRSRVDQFKQKYDGTIVPFDVSKSYKPGPDLAVPTADILRQIPDISTLGLTVISPSPPAITIHLEGLVEKQLPVKLVYTGGELVADPKATVTVRAAQSVWDSIDQSDPNATLRTKPVNLRGYETGKEVDITAEIVRHIRVGDTYLEIEPQHETVTFRVKIKQLTQSKTIRITVRVLNLPAWFEGDTWAKLELDRKDEMEWRPEITVLGTATDLAKLKAEDIHAYVVLTDDDKKPLESYLTRPVTIHLPKDLKVHLADAEPPTVQFKIQKRSEVAR